VSKILKRMARALREQAATVDRQRARHSMRLEYLYAEAIAGWQLSQADTTRRRQRKTDGGSSGGSASVAEIVSENQHGDPRYLDEARRILADHRNCGGWTRRSRSTCAPHAIRTTG
jgi:hypothetical protein